VRVDPERFRADIQGLRAVAVNGVLTFHVWPEVLPGGYVGVDVFFVISGYLITGLLLRELERTGSISLVGFYQRRVRRLLPAATLTLIAVACAITLLPQSRWEDATVGIAASALVYRELATGIGNQSITSGPKIQVVLCSIIGRYLLKSSSTSSGH
jgi:peptidoglycan/LPS O-acetylase OafA/YrhL